MRKTTIPPSGEPGDLPGAGAVLGKLLIAVPGQVYVQQ